MTNNKTKEQWKTITDFPNYEVSNLGKVRNKTTKNLLKQIISPYGYYSVGLYNKSKQKPKMFRVNRLVADAFLDIPNCFINYDKSKLQVHHKDWNKLNNCSNNLEWITQTTHNHIGKIRNYQRIRDLYNISLSVMDNLRIFKDNNIKVCRRTLYNFCKDNGINPKGEKMIVGINHNFVIIADRFSKLKTYFNKAYLNNFKFQYITKDLYNFLKNLSKTIDEIIVEE